MNTVLIKNAINEFVEWNNKKRSRGERHEVLKALLFKHCEAKDKTLEITIQYVHEDELKTRRGRIDFWGDDMAIEIDHSMKPRSFSKLKHMINYGHKACWIIMRPTSSYPRNFGKFTSLCHTLGIIVILIKNLQGGYGNYAVQEKMASKN